MGKERRRMQEKELDYHRTANEKELESFEQQKACASWAALDAGATIIGTIDNVKDNRHASRELSEAVNRGEIDCIVVKDKDRLKDNELLAEFETNGVRVIDID
jgi:DNA invertase Pin-like site-specific DNA recombinase